MPALSRTFAILLLIGGIVVIVAGVIGALTSSNALVWLTPLVGVLLVVRALPALRSRESRDDER